LILAWGGEGEESWIKVAFKRRHEEKGAPRMIQANVSYARKLN